MAIIVPNRSLLQPSGALRTSRSTPIGDVLNHVFVGSDLSGYDRAGKLCLATNSNQSLRATSRGMAVVNGTGAGPTASFVPLFSLPIVLVFYGWWNNANGWIGAALSSSAGGHSFSISCASSNTVQVDIRFNFGTNRTLSVSCSGAHTGTPACVIVQAFSDTDYRIYANGNQANGTLSCGSSPSFNSMWPISAIIQGGTWLVGSGGGRSLTDTQALEYTRNPAKLWEMFKSPPRIWLDVAAGGDSTITTTTGNASAAGVTALVSQSIAATVGNATAAGTSALLNSGVVATVGNASATGTSALLNASIAASVGNAAAAGTQATISAGGSTTITCSVGNASAAAPSALVSQSVTCSVGNAAAAGTTATISSGSSTTVSCVVGNASAAGTAVLISKSVACSVGSATAAGVTSSIVVGGPLVVACSVGTAMASGPVCIVRNGQPLASRGSSGRYLKTTQQSTRPSNLQQTARTNTQR